MANDAQWPEVVSCDKHDIICPKCGYERLISDEVKSRTTCPDCRVSYTTSLAGIPTLKSQANGSIQDQQAQRGSGAVANTTGLSETTSSLVMTTKVSSPSSEPTICNSDQTVANKTKGKLTVVGKIGIALGILSLFAFTQTGKPILMLGGLMFVVGSYLYARKSVEELQPPTGNDAEKLDYKANTSTGNVITKAQQAVPVFSMLGVQDHLEVFDDKLTISPKGVLGFMNKGLKGTKTIPFASISAIQFKEAGAMFSGYLQFTIPGGNESKGGLFAAVKDENSFMFATKVNNRQATEIKQYIEAKTKELRSPKTMQLQSPISLSDELQKLADLRDQGILTDQEFQSAKNRLIG
jgi:hypothetical protein